jgi:hypothetical protein
VYAINSGWFPFQSTWSHLCYIQGQFCYIQRIVPGPRSTISGELYLIPALLYPGHSVCPSGHLTLGLLSPGNCTWSQLCIIQEIVSDPSSSIIYPGYCVCPPGHLIPALLYPGNCTWSWFCYIRGIVPDPSSAISGVLYMIIALLYTGYCTWPQLCYIQGIVFALFFNLYYLWTLWDWSRSVNFTFRCTYIQFQNGQQNQDPPIHIFPLIYYRILPEPVIQMSHAAWWFIN